MTDGEKAAWAAATTDADGGVRREVLEVARPRRTTHLQADVRKARRLRRRQLGYKSGKKRGSMTDRGMVFVLSVRRRTAARRLGAGTTSPRTPACRRSATDRSSPRRGPGAGAKRVGQGDDVGAERADSRPLFGPGHQAADSDNDYQEVWHYRKDLLPKGVSYIQVDAVFVTKKGYGKDVLQRESDILTTLNAAKQKPSRSAKGSRP